MNGIYPRSMRSTGGTYSFSIADSGAVPEPATWAMMRLGFGAIGGALRFGRRKQAVFAVHA